MLDDHEGAVREVAQVYELIKTHQPLLFLRHHHQQEAPPAATTDKQLAQSLLSEALRALNIALSFMNQEQQESTTSSTTAASSPLEHRGGNKRRRSSATEGNNSSSSRVHLTTVPYEDGFEWRKYGEKKINGTPFTRSYFKCTYKDDRGCLAKKYVQQKDDKSDPPVFQVAYNNEHTCSNCTNITSLAKKSNCNSSPPAPTGHHDVTRIKVTVKQEETVVLPPLADVVSAFQSSGHQQMLCQVPVPVGDLQYGTAGDAYQQHADIPSSATSSSAGGSSCVSPVSCDGLDVEPIMAELLMGDDDDHELQDLEVLLLCNSFKYY